MSLSPTIPNVYRYGFLTSRAVDLLAHLGGHDMSQEDLYVLGESKGLIEKIIRGEEFLVGPGPGEVHNLRPDDVEIFNFVLTTDSYVKSLAQDEQNLRRYLDTILATCQKLLSDPKAVGQEEVEKTAGFLSGIADALLDSARESARQYPSDEPVRAVHE